MASAAGVARFRASLDPPWKDYEMRKGSTRKPQADEPATPGKNYITPSGLQRLKDEHRRGARPSRRRRSCAGSVAAHPFGKLRVGSCKKRKDGAPSVGMVQCKDGPPAHDSD